MRVDLPMIFAELMGIVLKERDVMEKKTGMKKEE